MEPTDKSKEELEKRVSTLVAANKDKQIVWRDTLSDGFLPIRAYTVNYAEKEKK